MGAGVDGLENLRLGQSSRGAGFDEDAVDDRDVGRLPALGLDVSRNHPAGSSRAPLRR